MKSLSGERSLATSTSRFWLCLFCIREYKKHALTIDQNGRRFQSSGSDQDIFPLLHWPPATVHCVGSLPFRVISAVYTLACPLRQLKYFHPASAQDCLEGGGVGLHGTDQIGPACILTNELHEGAPDDDA